MKITRAEFLGLFTGLIAAPIIAAIPKNAPKVFELKLMEMDESNQDVISSQEIGIIRSIEIGHNGERIMAQITGINSKGQTITFETRNLELAMQLRDRMMDQSRGISI